MSDKHEKALDLTEKALEAMDRGDDKAADKMIAEAKKLDPSAPEEVLADLDEAGEGDEDEDEDEGDEDEGDEDEEGEDSDEGEFEDGEEEGRE